MISNQILQTTIDGLKAITKVDLTVIDTEGTVLATTEDMKSNKNYSVVSDIVSVQAENMSLHGTQYFQVFDDNGPVIYLNEMEWINGEIWANVYLSNDIVRINPQTGEVVARINFDNLVSKIRVTADTDVMNGIAYDKKSGRIFVTGKKWNKLFEVELVKKK
jgi:glutamine cyclotransferase